MTISERLRFILEADGSTAIRTFEQVGRSAERDLGAAETRTERMSANFTKAGAAMLATGGLMVAGLTRAASVAGDLSEAVNLTGVTFGEAAGKIDEFVETTADGLGQSERAAREATARFGGLLQNLGYTQQAAADASIQLTTLASDLGSAFNTDPADAVEALGAALRGESEPIRRYNVMLSDAAIRQRAVELGLAATTQEVDANAKAQAALNLIMDQTARYQGDFANTADSAANAQRRLAAQWEDFQAQLGEQALPIMQDVLGAGNRMLGWMTDLNDATGGMVGTVATWGAGLLVTGGAVSTVAGRVLTMSENLRTLAARLDLATTKSRLIGGALLGAFSAVLLNRMSDTSDRMAQFAMAADDVVSGGTDAEAVLTDLVRSSGRFEEMVRNSGLSLNELAEMLTDASVSADDFQEAVARAAVAAGASDPDLLGAAATATELYQAFNDARRAADTLAGASGSAGLGALAEMSVRARDRLADATHGVGEMRDRAGEAAGKIRSIEDAFAGLLGLLDASDALRNAQAGFDALAERAVGAYLSAQEGSADAEEAARGYEQAIDDQKRKVIDFARAVGSIPPQAVSSIIALIDEGRFAEAEARLAYIARNREIGLVPVTSPQGLLNNQAAAAREPRAFGGPVQPGSTYLVGERGPEVLVMGSGSGTVIPNGGTPSAVGTTTLAIDGRQFGLVISDALNTQTRRTRNRGSIRMSGW